MIHAQFCEFTKSHWTVYFKWVNYMVCEFYLNKVIKIPCLHLGQSFFLGLLTLEGVNSVSWETWRGPCGKELSFLTTAMCEATWDPPHSWPSEIVRNNVGYFKVLISNYTAIDNISPSRSFKMWSSNKVLLFIFSNI